MQTEGHATPIGTGTEAKVPLRRRRSIARFSKFIGSIPVLDVANADHVPPEYMECFGPFVQFIATTSNDIDEMLKGVGGKGEVVPFPTVPDFQRPIPSAPAIEYVKKLYNLGLMVGSSGPDLFHASLGRIADAVEQSGFADVTADVTAEKFLEQVQDYVREDHEREWRVS